MYAKIYGEPAVKTEKAEAKAGEEEKGEAEGDEDAKPKKKVKFGKNADQIGLIQVFK
jgi:hypothetical protein